MKVCHISSAHAPNDTRIFHKQCASLARAGYDTTFVVKAKDPQSVGETTEKGVRVIQVPVDTSAPEADALRRQGRLPEGSGGGRGHL